MNSKLNIIVVATCLAMIACKSVAERVYHHEICNNFLQKSFRGSCEQCCVKKGFDKDLSACEVGFSCTCAKEMEVKPEDRVYFQELERNDSVCSLLRRGLDECGDCCDSKGFNHHLVVEGKLTNSCTCIRRQQFTYDEIKDKLETVQFVSKPDVNKLFPTSN